MHRRARRAQRLFGIGDGGENIVIDFHEIGGVAREVAIGGDDDGHGMAHEIDAVGRQNVMVRHAQAGQRRAAGNRADVFRCPCR